MEEVVPWVRLVQRLQPTGHKKTAQLHTLFALAGLMIVKNRLLVPTTG
jgi:hypothetical protein